MVPPRRSKLVVKPMTKKIIILTALLTTLLRLDAQPVSSTDTVTVHNMHGTYYSDRFVGRKTSSGEVFRQDKYTAAHKSYKFGTLLLVTNPKNGQQVIVKVNDRCPRTGIIDLTRKAAKSIGITSHKVTVQVLPERYTCYWEMQDNLQELMQSGHFLDSMDKDNIRDTPSYKSNISKEEPAKNQNTAKSPVKKSTELYDIELCTVDNRNAAQKAVEKLPIHYRDKAQTETLSNQKIVVRLDLSVRQEKAKEIQSELYGIFPHCRPILAE